MVGAGVGICRCLGAGLGLGRVGRDVLRSLLGDLTGSICGCAGQNRAVAVVGGTGEGLAIESCEVGEGKVARADLLPEVLGVERGDLLAVAVLADLERICPAGFLVDADRAGFQRVRVSVEEDNVCLVAGLAGLGVAVGPVGRDGGDSPPFVKGVSTPAGTGVA